MTETTRSALIFGARNLGRAIIETLVAQGWAVAGAARSDETLANVTAAGALALRSDITDQAAVRATVEEAAQALGPVDLVVNAAAAYGGARTGPFGGGPIADAAPDAFDSWSVAPARSAFAFLSDYEGFGLTPLEALGAGMPVVLLDTEVAREIYGPAATYVERADPALIATALTRVLFDSPERSRLIEAAVPQLERYSWRECAQRTLQVLLSCARS